MNTNELIRFKYRFMIESYYYNNLLYQIVLENVNKQNYTSTDDNYLMSNFVQESLANSSVPNYTYLNIPIPATNFPFFQKESNIINLCDMFTSKLTLKSACHRKYIFIKF